MVADVTTHPDTAPYIDNYIPYNVYAYVAVPCVVQKNWVAMLVVNSTTARNWSEDEVTLLQETVARLWLFIEHARAIEALRQEINERTKNQEIIRRQLAEIEAIYQTAPIGLAILDCDLRFVRLNHRLAEINGISVEEHLGRTVREIVPDLADTVEPLFHQIIETGEPLLDLEINGETAAEPGIKRTWIESWFPVKDASGQIIGINVVVQEITERKQAEIALREKEQQLQQLSDSMPQIVWMSNEFGELEYVNYQWRQFSGLTLEQSRNNDLMTQCFHPEDAQLLLNQWKIAQQTKQNYEVEARLKRATDGTYRWFLIRCIPEIDEHGQVRRWYGTSTDIHDRKIAELNE